MKNDHLTFSQNRRRRFQDAGIFREIFNEIVLKCIQLGIVSGETGVADGSFLPSNVSWNSRYEVVETVNRSTIKYMSELGRRTFFQGYRKPENEETEKKSLKSCTGPECGYIHQARKKGLGYLTEMTVDTHSSFTDSTKTSYYTKVLEQVLTNNITLITGIPTLFENIISSFFDIVKRQCGLVIKYLYDI